MYVYNIVCIQRAWCENGHWLYSLGTTLALPVLFISVALCCPPALPPTRDIYNIFILSYLSYTGMSHDGQTCPSERNNSVSLFLCFSVRVTFLR
jgi:hypothetical protein